MYHLEEGSLHRGGGICTGSGSASGGGKSASGHLHLGRGVYTGDCIWGKGSPSGGGGSAIRGRRTAYRSLGQISKTGKVGDFLFINTATKTSRKVTDYVVE